MAPPLLRRIRVPQQRACLQLIVLRPSTCCSTTLYPTPIAQHYRPFSSSYPLQNWLSPLTKIKYKTPKGRPRVATGGSTRGTTVIWGDYGLRLRDHDRKISAEQLRVGEEVIKRRLKGTNFRFFSRFAADIAVYAPLQESRMGTGKGKFSHWACRVPVSRILFELSSDSHEQVVRDAFRLAAAKLPGLYEFVRKGDPPMMGLTRVTPETTAEHLRHPRRKFPGEELAQRLPGSK